MEDGALGVCARHHDRAALDTCDRCGAFVCEACRAFYDYRPLCPGCLERRSFRQPASRRAKWAMALGVAGVVLVFIPFGLPAAVIGHTELAAIRAGQAPEGGKGYARAGVVLGWLGTLFFGLMMLALALFLLGVWLGFG